MPYSKHYKGKTDFARFFLEKLKNNEEITAVNDQNITPTFVDDISNALVKIIDNKPIGIFQVASTDSITPYDFALALAEKIGADKNLIKGVPFAQFNAS